MRLNNTSWKVVESKDDLEELRQMCLVNTLDEMAQHYGLTRSKMYTVLRINGLKAKSPERPKKPKVEKLHKKDHEITKWASYENKGKVRDVYYNMLKRCYKKDNRGYKHYGGRGIGVCDEWRNDCCCFYKWAKENGYKEGYQLDRINNDGNYEPDNCRWISPLENSYNKRNTRIITYNGISKNLLEWEKETGIPGTVLADRIFKYKWSIEKALTTKPKNIK